MSELQGQFSVFIVNSENKVEAKQIVVSDIVGHYYLVGEGLKENDKIILEGLQKVRSGLEVIPVITKFEDAKQISK